MSLYYTPGVHRPHPSHEDPDDNPPTNAQTIPRPQRRPFTAQEDRQRQRQRQRETPLNDSADTGPIFIFPQPSSSTSPIPSDPYSSPRSPSSDDSLISRPAHRRRDAATSQLSPASQPESFIDVSLDVDGISTPTTTITLSIGSSPGSAFTEVGEDEGSVDDGQIEAMLWDWYDGGGEGVDRPIGELRSRRSVRPDDMLQPSFVSQSQVRPYPLHHGSGERLRALLERKQSRDRLDDASRFRHFQQPRSRSYSPLSTPSSNRESDLLSLAPHPKIRIPFLDFFASILGVEESTMELLTRCSTIETHGSVLFPGHTIQPLPVPTSRSTTGDENDDSSSITAPTDQETDQRVTVHGFRKALLPSSIERDSWASLKEGLTVFYSTATPVSAQSPGRLLGLVQLWGLVSHVCVQGGNAFRGVYSSTPASPSGIEEVE
jgi:hypothetical protein